MALSLVPESEIVVDLAFGHWFAWFTDGEGSFDIQRTNKATFCCRFHLVVRSDDEPIIREIHDRLGFGSVSWKRSPSIKNAQIGFFASKKVDCVALRQVFETYPLRAKKAADFKIWSRALECWVAHRNGDPWDDMAALKGELESSRQYRRECE